jgi:hypothetical protein
MSAAPPQIFFPGDQPERGTAVKPAYLVWIDGQPWAYPNLLDVQKPPQDAKGAFLLDPLRIVEESRSATGQPTFIYR